MGFQRLLAGRYIFAQKRHSVLTICSIVAALTLMTMLFTGFSTILSCLRAYEYDQHPYHCLVYSVTQEQGKLLSKADGIESCKLRQNRMDGTYTASIFFTKDVRYEDEVLNAAFEKAKLGYDYEDGLDNGMFELNHPLMQYDFVGLKAWYNIAQIFALFYVFVIFLAMVMRLIIDTAFEISSKERERQFGVLQSIGATPRQIVGIITMEGSLLSIIGIPLGLLCGTGLAYAAFQIIVQNGITDVFFSTEGKAAEIMQFSVNPWLLLASAVTGFIWVWLSAYATGMRIIRMSPMQAISNRSNKVKKVRRHRIFTLLFGWVGTLAARNTRRSPKRFAITVVSLTISIALFASFSYVIDTVEESYTRVMEDGSIDYDFMINTESEDVQPLDYQKPLQELEECGYFSNVHLNIGRICFYPLNETDNLLIAVDYCNQASYESFFSDAPPISYAELAASGGYLMLEHNAATAARDVWSDMKQVQTLESMTMNVRKNTTITPEEYDALSEKEREGWKPYIFEDGRTGEITIQNYSKFVMYPADYQITARYAIPDAAFCEERYISENVIQLIAPLSLYEQRYSNYDNSNISFTFICDLADDEVYHDALAFIVRNEALIMGDDRYTENLIVRSSIALIKIIAAFISAMIALIALVNLINIISTGILNRRSELASMQCVGMTQRQLMGMTIVECLQYTLISGIAASVLCVLLMIVTFAFLKVMTMADDFWETISLTKPMLTIWLAAGAAFITAFVTSLISLNGMKQQPLVDQIRSVD